MDSPSGQRVPRRQRYSLYHSDQSSAGLKQWMAPYADMCVGRKLVLDVGCGPGYFLDLLRERGVTGIGIDVDPEMVAACREQDFQAEVADARQLSGWNDHFDAIHAGHIIEHMDGQTAVYFLERCADALQHDGLLILRTPNWENETVRNGAFWYDHTHVRPYPLPVLQQILLDLGFTIRHAGAEPRGWNDLYLVGVKSGTPADD